LPVDYQTRFGNIISGASTGAEMGRVLLVSQLHFLYALDVQWTKQNIIPLLDWGINEKCAEHAWHGYLYWGKWHDALLPDLLPLYLDACRKLPHEPDRIRGRLYEHLADIAVYGSSNPFDWLDNCLGAGSDEDRVNWAQHVSHNLASLSSEAVEMLWISWIDSYWSRRIQGIPIPLTPDEVASMVEWVVQLQLVFPQAVDRVTASPVPDLKYTSVFYDLA